VAFEQRACEGEDEALVHVAHEAVAVEFYGREALAGDRPAAVLRSILVRSGPGHVAAHAQQLFLARPRTGCRHPLSRRGRPRKQQQQCKRTRCGQAGSHLPAARAGPQAGSAKMLLAIKAELPVEVAVLLLPEARLSSALQQVCKVEVNCRFADRLRTLAVSFTLSSAARSSKRSAQR